MLNKLLKIFESKLFKSSGIYTLSNIFEKSIPFLLLPVLTRYLSTEDYGIVSMFVVLVGLTIPFTGLATKPAVLRSYYKKEIDFPAYVSNTLFILLFSTAGVTIIFAVFADQISEYSGFPADWLFTVIIVSSTQYVANILLVIWQAQNKPIQYGVYKIGLTALNLSIALGLIIGLGYGWEGKILGQIFATALFFVIGVIILWRYHLIKFTIVKEYISHALSYGVPLIPHSLSTFLITMIDRVFITNMVSLSETGIYTVGYQIGMIVGVLADSFNKAWTPWLFEKLNEGGTRIKKKIVKFTYAYIVGITALAIFLSLIAPWFMSFFVGTEFSGSVQFVFWIAIGYSFKGMYYMVTNYIFFVEKTHLLSWMTFVAAGVNILLNYFFIRSFGAIGAAQATTITYLIQFLLTWYLAARTYKMPWLLK